MVFTTVLYSEAEEKQIWNAAEEIVLKELVYIESVERGCKKTPLTEKSPRP